MSGLGRRLRAERDLWHAVWKQIETFLDRIDSAASDDERYARTMCALLPVFSVIERARKRSVGYRLADALPAEPGGLDAKGSVIASLTTGALMSFQRVPGVEDCEFAVAGYRINDEGKIDSPPWSFMTRTVTLATFRDEKHRPDGQDQVVLRTPTYDFGDLKGVPMVAIQIGDEGLFPRKNREEAMNGGEAKFTPWKELRDARVAAVKTLGGAAATPLSARLASLTYPLNFTELLSIGVEAGDHREQCKTDVDQLENARGRLAKAGVVAEVTNAIANAIKTIQKQADDFDLVADQLSAPAVFKVSYGNLLSIGQTLVAAEGTPGLPGLPAALEALDGAATAAMNEAVESRIGYPDGPLRQLRMLQWTLRFFWEHRTAWMKWRHGRVLARLYADYMRGFTESLAQVLAGKRSGIPLPENSKVGREVLVGATEIPLAGIPDLPLLTAGQIVIVGGDRPTAAPVIDVLSDGKKLPPMRLKVPRLVVSVATGKSLPGMPGLIKVATPLADAYRRLDDDELRRGASHGGPAGDALVQALVAHRSRLALVLGDGGGPDGRPAPPALAKPYPGVDRFYLEGPIGPADNRLFLKSLPPASQSGTGEQLPVARPGEILLLYGVDEEGYSWQTAVEVDRAVVTTGAEAKRDEAAGATPVPPCCAHDKPVMVVYVRSMQLPSALHGAFLHRSFAGFGARSLLTGVMLPEAIDGDTSSDIRVGPDLLRPRRDPELRAAVRVLDDWMPKETA